MPTKITDMTLGAGTPADDALVEVAVDPSGTPLTRAFTIAEIRAAVLSGLTLPNIIETQTPSGIAQVDFSLPTGYNRLVLDGWLLPDTDAVWSQLLCDDGAGFDNTNEYGYSWWIVINGAVADGGADGQPVIAVSRSSNQLVGSDPNEGVHFTINIKRALDAVWTNFNIYTSYYSASSVGNSLFVVTGTHQVAAALSSIRLQFSAGNIADGSVSLIGYP